VIFVATDGAHANPERGVHTFCHALPGTWHQMAVMLSASSALAWWAGIVGSTPGELMAALPAGALRPNAPLFLPYLSGERTPHADPAATASFLGITHATTRDDLSYAVVEGVAFLFADGLQALREAGSEQVRLLAIGGGARSDTWLQMLADLLARPVDRPAGAEVGPALGAARLAMMSAGHAREAVVKPPPIARTFGPDAARGAALGERLTRFRAAYVPVRGLVG